MAIWNRKFQTVFKSYDSVDRLTYDAFISGLEENGVNSEIVQVFKDINIEEDRETVKNALWELNRQEQPDPNERRKLYQKMAGWYDILLRWQEDSEPGWGGKNRP